MLESFEFATFAGNDYKVLIKLLQIVFLITSFQQSQGTSSEEYIMMSRLLRLLWTVS